MKRLVESAFEEPRSYDEALEIRRALIRDVDEIQGDLAVRKDDDDWRTTALSALRQKREELRSVKDWIRKNDRERQSEWALLARAHALLQTLEPIAPGHTDDIEALLDAIELVVPGQYLQKGKTP